MFLNTVVFTIYYQIKKLEDIKYIACMSNVFKIPSHSVKAYDLDNKITKSEIMKPFMQFTFTSDTH